MRDMDTTDRYDAGPRRPDGDGGRLVPPAVLVAALVIPAVLLVTVLVMVRNVSDDAAEAAMSEPVTAIELPAPGAESTECLDLIGALPESLGDATRVALNEPAPQGVADYRIPESESVVGRCGIEPPPTFTVGAALQEVNDVQWFHQDDPDPAVTASTWVAVDRPQYVAMTLPGASGTGPIQDLSDTLTEHLEAVEPDPAPIG